ncbi:DMT family transporter [Patulibacter minatonensis]|uniref:DMT family transporter n=1 Tax=Patulibacter minatonensis TaxID=298163 RepID=UPI0004B5F5B1|nr:DMT family transporter [Patulibacter minatonensis]
MSPLLTGLLLAVVASVALNASYLMQHAGSSGAPEMDVRRPVATLTGLLRSRWWLAGAVLGVVGSLGHAAALYGAPLSLVQAFAAGGLVLTVPVAARVFGQRLGRREAWAVAALVVSLATLGIGATSTAARGVPVGPLVVALTAAALVAAVLVVLADHRRRAVALGTAGGILYGAGDAATKALAVVAHHGVLGVVASPWLLVYVAICGCGFACFQRGLQLGPVVPVVVTMTAATNAVAILTGIVAFGEPLGATPLLATLHAVAFAVAGWAGLRLVARGNDLHADAPAAGSVRVPDALGVTGPH